MNEQIIFSKQIILEHIIFKYYCLALNIYFVQNSLYILCILYIIYIYIHILYILYIYMFYIFCIFYIFLFLIYCLYHWLMYDTVGRDGQTERLKQDGQTKLSDEMVNQGGALYIRTVLSRLSVSFHRLF